MDDPLKRWKLSPMDLEARSRWLEYSRAKDEMFAHTDIPEAPWYVVNADVKKHARLNCIAHLLEQVPYEDLTVRPKLDLPPRPKNKARKSIFGRRTTSRRSCRRCTAPTPSERGPAGFSGLLRPMPRPIFVSRRGGPPSRFP